MNRQAKGLNVALRQGLALLILCWCAMVQAQVPHKLNYQGFLTNAGGAPINSTVTMVFRLYAVESGGVALYSETQSVAVGNGLFDVVLGTVTPLNLPFDVPYYLGVSVAADPEMAPRRTVTASPYALRAASADALASTATVVATQLADGSVTKPKLSAPGGTAGQVLGTDGTSLVWQTPSAGGGGISAVTASPPLASSGGATPNISLTGTTAVANGGTGAATLASNGILLGQGTNAVTTVAAGTAGQILTATAGAPAWTGSPSLSGNLSLVGSTATAGNILKGGQLFIHDTGTQNIFVGSSAGNSTLTGGANTVIGAGALQNNTSGNANVASGLQALGSNTTGARNVAVGYAAFGNNTTGNDNIAIGFGAGNVAGASGSNNIFIGSDGVAGESKTIRLGDPAVHTRTLLAGNVGIGTSSPQVNLHVAANTPKTNPAITRAFAVLTNEPLGANQDPNNPFGLDVRLVGGATLADRAVYIQSTDFNTAAGGNILLQPGVGNVGIGTTTPTKAKVEISGFSGSFQATKAGFLNENGAGTTPGGFSISNFSLFASDSIGAGVYFAFSDERIKRVEGRSNAAGDLATLKGIEVTDYSYIDIVAKGAGKQKKVIAQQLEKVYPQAVVRTTDVVPDIYRKAEVKDGWVKLATNLKKGERVRLIGKGSEGVHEVLETAPGRFRTDFAADADAVFVYGREVKDFGNVDYEAIAMLNVSATQELDRRLEKQAAALAAQSAQASGQVAVIADQAKRIAELEQVRDAQMARIDALEMQAAQIAMLKQQVAQMIQQQRSAGMSGAVVGLAAR